MQRKQQRQKQRIAASKDCQITWQPTLSVKLEDGNHQLFAILTTWNTKQIQRNIGKILSCKCNYIIFLHLSGPILSNSGLFFSLRILLGNLTCVCYQNLIHSVKENWRWIWFNNEICNQTRKSRCLSSVDSPESRRFLNRLRRRLSTKGQRYLFNAILTIVSQTYSRQANENPSILSVSLKFRV